MVLEWLKFQVNPSIREKFVKKDEEIWTATLAEYPGFLGKEVWIAAKATDEVIFVIHWQSREQWKSVPLDVLVATEEKFARAIGQDNYQMIESKEYQIRKFSKIKKL